MILSNRNGLKNTRNMLRVFGGLNETYSCTGLTSIDIPDGIRGLGDRAR